MSLMHFYIGRPRPGNISDDTSVFLTKGRCCNHTLLSERKRASPRTESKEIGITKAEA